MNSKKNIINFWKKKIDLLQWVKKPKKIIKIKKDNMSEWYSDGKLNLSFECIDNNIQKGLGNKTALIFINVDGSSIRLTYNTLLDCVERFCQILKVKYKVNSKKKILIHASASFESAISMLACARLGSCHSVVFQDLQKDAMSTRIKLFKPDIIITRDDDSNIRKKFLKNKLKVKSKILVFRKNKSKMRLNFCDSNQIINNYKLKKCRIASAHKSNHKLFVLFTSGSTGEPKGITHSTGGYLLYAKYSCINFFGITEKSIVLTASDAGWINGHTYALYGPLSLGATSIILESPTLILNDELFKKIIYQNKISVLYLPVTLIRIFRSINQNKKFKNNYIQTLGSMGEPLAPEVAKWFAKTFNHKGVIVNTYFQTETGGVITAPKFNDITKNCPHGSVGNPSKIYGLKLIKKKKGLGEVILKYPWPGCMINIINGIKIWKKYWTKEGYFKLFDIGSFDKTNSLNIHGRNDDVINIRGHRIGSEEIESIVLKVEGIIECACIAIPEKIEGFNLILFAVVKKKELKNKDIKTYINKKIINNFGTFAVPKNIYLIDSLPKTKSGKILRRILREIALNPKIKNYGDLSTIMDISTIEKIKKNVITSL